MIFSDIRSDILQHDDSSLVVNVSRINICEKDSGQQCDAGACVLPQNQDLASVLKQGHNKSRAAMEKWLVSSALPSIRQISCSL